MKTLVSALAVASLAGSAFGFTEIGPRGNMSMLPQTVDRFVDYGDITQWVNITATPLDEHVDGGTRGTPQYSNMTLPAGGNLAATATAASPVIGFNDYQMALDGGSAFDTPLVNPLQGLDAMRWIGGWGNNGGPGVNQGQLTFFFLQNDSTTAASFSITGFNEGNFIYTFNLLPIAPVYVPTEGYLAVVSTGSVFMRQFYSYSQPTVGAQNTANDFVFAYGGSIGNQPISERFELQIPAPGATALMGLAGLVGLRRRR